MDYFTKWAEIEALVNIRDMDVKKFIWRNIVTRFGIPESLVSDNSFDITNRYSTLTYPQSNGQAEATNKVIVNRLKKRLEDAKGRWAKELPSVLWAYRTTPRRVDVEKVELVGRMPGISDYIAGRISTTTYSEIPGTWGLHRIIRRTEIDLSDSIPTTGR
nr:uncharacterized protein LOC112032757 [Quercus suber]